jgi:site-specific DNA recombinase
VPFADPGIPREWVLAARAAIKDNVKVSNCGRRFWELTGGVLRCEACGGAMGTNFVTTRGAAYYRCGRKYRVGSSACRQGKYFRAEDTEALVWDFVSSILKDPDGLKRGLDEMLEQEKRLASRRPEEEERTWLKKLAELEAREERLLDLYLDNKLEIDRYASRVADIKRSRETVQGEIDRIRDGVEHLQRLERDRDALLNHYAKIVPEGLDSMEPEERNHVYKTLDLTVLGHGDGALEVRWALDADPCRYNEPLLPGSCRTRGR